MPPSDATLRREGLLVGLTRNTILLSISSLFSDIANEMLYPVLPVFLTQTLMASGSVVGLIEGMASATQNIIQGLSGAVSDRLQRRKPVALVGYVLAALAKPLIGLAPIWPVVLGARFLDRLGTGVRSAPRDAMVAASADPAHRGKAFGLEGLGDNAGAFFGPLIAVLILAVRPGAYRPIFFLTVVPGLLATLMVLLVSEKPDGAKVEAGPVVGPLPRFPAAYFRYLLVSALFGLGNSSNAFLILQTRHVGASLKTTILIYAGVNLVAALASYPVGALSDRLGRRALLALAFAVFTASYLGFALSRNPAVITGMFLFYGLFQGAFRAAGKALAVDLAPAERHAGGIGWYGATVGLTGFVASLVAGLLWDHAGHAAVFAWGVGFSALALVALFVLVPRGRPA